MNKFEETGSVEGKQRSGRTPSITIETNCTAISEKLSMKPRTSSRKLSEEFGAEFKQLLTRFSIVLKSIIHTFDFRQLILTHPVE